MNPTVSFVVPCYKLAHLLGECLRSILDQTFPDFEVLVLDDRSPDNTGEVANSFGDPRIRHIRNEENLGHLRNYNKGIAMARGRYIWLISADDLLRRPYILQRYVDVMENNSTVGYVFCPGVGLEAGVETGILPYSAHGDADRIFRRREFFVRLLESNSVLAAAGMVRRECYERLGAFPLDLPYAGDWYLWLLFALHYEVAYLAEPMVSYRQHTLSMTNTLNDKDPRICTNDDLNVLWRIKRKAEEANYTEVLERVDFFLVDRAQTFLTFDKTYRSRRWFTEEDLQASTDKNARDPRENRSIRSRVYARAGDTRFWEQNFSEALRLYQRSLDCDRLNPSVLTKYALLRIGTPGIRLREGLLALRGRARHANS